MARDVATIGYQTVLKYNRIARPEDGVF